MKAKSLTLAGVGLAGAAAAVTANRLVERRRRLAAMPIGIARSAGMTLRRCRSMSGLQARAALHPVGQRFTAQ